MLARMQSFYFLTAALFAFSSSFFPFWYFAAETPLFLLDFRPLADAGVIHVFSLYVSSIVSPVTGIVSIAAIFLYKNRSLQSTLIVVLILLFLVDLLSGLTAAHFMNQKLGLSFGSGIEHSPGAGFFVLLPEPLLFWLAMKGVKKDEKIVNAYKRL
ncbi:DUF4293 domain-containing protein [Prosthecochloris sp.]|uniref:DUF4293 domain-containing protein n=1 Tax=Prosthecochloris sp. TaxID=290513 RepID=UPI0025E27AA4|nr:DUF4293 domain-containing protein [Prosthecochloris sp.]